MEHNQRYPRTGTDTNAWYPAFLPPGFRKKFLNILCRCNNLATISRLQRLKPVMQTYRDSTGK